MERAGAPQDGTVATASIRGTTDARTPRGPTAAMSAEPPPADPIDADLAASTRLLAAELPDDRFVDDRYLRWLYTENPLGPAIQRSTDEGGTRVAHYAIVPQTYRDRNGPVATAFSLNAVVRAGHQRAGHFRTNGLSIYEEAPSHGMKFVIGVANEKSTGAVVKYMGWRLVGPLPVRVLHPARRTEPDVQHVPVDRAMLRSDWFADLAAELDEHWAVDLTNRYDPASLRWRLSCPHTDYHLHVSRHIVAVSTPSAAGPVPAAVVLKLLPRGTASIGAPTGPFLGAVMRHHRAAFGVYAGYNRHLAVRGLRPPRRLQPSPLNLIVRSFGSEWDQDRIRLDTFEFLDMDAY